MRTTNGNQTCHRSSAGTAAATRSRRATLCGNMDLLQFVSHTTLSLVLGELPGHLVELDASLELRKGFLLFGVFGALRGSVSDGLGMQGIEIWW